MALVEACGEDPGLLCEVVFDVTSNELAASLANDLLARPLRVIAIVVLSVLAYRLGSRAISRFTRRYETEIARRLERADELGVVQPRQRTETRRYQRLYAIASAGRSGLGIAIGVSAALLILAQFVRLGPILAGAGLAGVVIGFGAQSLIADLLAGFSMLVEDQYGVGDWIDVDGRIGEVERVGLRTTSFRDIDGTVWHLSNGRISGVGNLTQRWARATLDIPLALDTDVAHAREVVLDVAQEMARDPLWAEDVISDPEIWGVTDWGPQGLKLRLVIPTRPLRNWDVNRQLRERLKARFEHEGIRMPPAQVLEVGGQVTRGAPLRVAEVDDSPPSHPGSTQHPARRRDGSGDPRRRRDQTERIPTEYGQVQPREPRPDGAAGDG